MNNDPWIFGWNAVGVIGQWVGALGTFAVVLVALHQNKPHIKVIARHDGRSYVQNGGQKEEKAGNIIVTATNVGMFPVEIIAFGYRMPQACYSTDQGEREKLPKLLNQGDHMLFKCDLKKFKQAGNNSYDIFYVSDINGKAYYNEANFVIKVRRFLWWHIAKHFGKYRRYLRK